MNTKTIKTFVASALLFATGQAMAGSYVQFRFTESKLG